MAYIILEKIEASMHVETIVAKQDLVNGQFVTLGELAEIELGGEAVEVTPAQPNDTEVVLHASVPLTYGDYEGELDFVLKAGKAGRGYHLKTGSQVAFSLDLVTGTPVDGAFVVATGTGIEVVAEKPATGLYGKVVTTFTDLNAGQMVSVKFFN